VSAALPHCQLAMTCTVVTASVLVCSCTAVSLMIQPFFAVMACHAYTAAVGAAVTTTGVANSGAPQSSHSL
jgi:hypothetical protein